MDPNDPVCYRCGKAGYKDYGYFLVQHLPDSKNKAFSIKSPFSQSGALTLGNYYTMVLCDKCIKKEYIHRVLVLMSFIEGFLAVLLLAALVLAGSFLFPAVVLAALVLSAACCGMLILIESRKSLSVTEGEICAARLYNRDHHYAKDGVFAMAPGKARRKFNV